MIYDTDPDIIGAGHNAGAFGEVGELYVAADDEYEILLNDTDTWMPLANLNEGISSQNVVLDGANGAMTLATPGSYELSIFATYSLSKVDGTPPLFDIGIFANGTLVERSKVEANVEQDAGFKNSAGMGTVYRVEESTEIVIKAKCGISCTVDFSHLNFSAKGIYS